MEIQAHKAIFTLSAVIIFGVGAVSCASFQSDATPTAPELSIVIQDNIQSISDSSEHIHFETAETMTSDEYSQQNEEAEAEQTPLIDYAVPEDANVTVRVYPVHNTFRWEKTDEETGYKMISFDLGETWVYQRDILYADTSYGVSEISLDTVTWASEESYLEAILKS